MKKQNTFLKASLAIILLTGFQTISAQDSLNLKTAPERDPIVTDRPDQTETPVLTTKGFFQVEVGTQTEFDEQAETSSKTQSTLFNTTLLKYGVTDNFELRLITEFGQDKLQLKDQEGTSQSFVTEGMMPVSVGAKIALQEETGIIPKISLITHLELPYFGKEEYKPEFIVPRFRFVFAHTLSDKLSFSYNLGAEWEDGSSAATGIYTASFGLALLDNLSMFVESYGFLKEKGEADHRLDGGFTFLVNKDLQFDISAGMGLNKLAPDYFISAGLSFRLNAFNKALRNN